MVILVTVLPVTIALVPLNLTALLAGVVSKFVPVIVTGAPKTPLVGLKLLIVGAGITVKFVELVPVMPFTVTVIFPVVAPVGTVVVMLVFVLAVATAVVPLNFTALFAKAGSKLVPVIVTTAPIPPLVGSKDVIVGVANVETDAGFPEAIFIL